MSLPEETRWWRVGGEREVETILIFHKGKIHRYDL
jgi:hypothetical protein